MLRSAPADAERAAGPLLAISRRLAKVMAGAQPAATPRAFSVEVAGFGNRVLLPDSANWQPGAAKASAGDANAPAAGGSVPAAGARVSLYDPMLDKNVPVQVRARDKDSPTVELEAVDTPRWLKIEEDAAARRK